MRQLSSDVAIIGAGVVGAACAYFLAEMGHSPTIIDPMEQGAATPAGAGIVAPGVTFHPSPYYFPLAYRAVSYLEGLVDKLGNERLLERCGLLYLITDPRSPVDAESLARQLRRHGMEGAPMHGHVEVIDPEYVHRYFPLLVPSQGAVYVDGPGRLNGANLRDALLLQAIKRGAHYIRARASIDSISQQEIALKADSTTITTQRLVLAAGAWSRQIIGQFSAVSLPISPQRGQILHLEVPDTRTDQWPIVMGDFPHYLLTFPVCKVLAGATHEDVGFHPKPTLAGIREIADTIYKVAPSLGSARLLGVNVGLRPVTPDGLPIIGRVPDLPSVIVASGHGAYGLQLGPYTGMLAAQLATDQEPDMDLTPYSPLRFSS
ncbi:FAD dependent oxidoreductase [Thermobaculum terrenum ATCC BAA-798]|uniref:FAD dependent oxidoreductase n=1 Tax=Thermobaculum terrenum (strain ATCC BAA-798 / CCMEE 7001 / YNP1) TaxID=525904 RepID=D1CBR6_THET1|nr:FAD-dependent oxidoreductase [Thermobaculum terrenum]ACZ42231.1 FAD dependent oxidoreductase [Thermobaculum terrenum ATCC BAA-798]